MADHMTKKSYDLTEITRLLLEMRENCIPKAGNAYEDPNRAEKYDALNAAIDLINNPSLLTRWISVKDRLPKNHEEVLACTDDGCMDVLWLGDAMGVLFWEDNNFVCYPKDYVAYWMPLPKPPKEETK